MIFDYMVSENAGLNWRTVATGLTRADVDRIRSAPTVGSYRRWFWQSAGRESYWDRPHRVNVWDAEHNKWQCVDGFYLKSDAEAHARALSARATRATVSVTSAPEGIWE